jgi:hypothetical protein
MNNGNLVPSTNMVSKERKRPWMNARRVFQLDYTAPDVGADMALSRRGAAEFCTFTQSFSIGFQVNSSAALPRSFFQRTRSSLATRYWAGVIPLAPVRPGVGADHAAAGADHARPARRDRNGF